MRLVFLGGFVVFFAFFLEIDKHIEYDHFCLNLLLATFLGGWDGRRSVRRYVGVWGVMLECEEWCWSMRRVVGVWGGLLDNEQGYWSTRRVGRVQKWLLRYQYSCWGARKVFRDVDMVVELRGHLSKYEDDCWGTRIVYKL